MKNLTDTNQIKIENHKQDYGVNIMLGFITSIMLIAVGAGAFLEDDLLSKRISRNFSQIAIALQILPILFSWIVGKIEYLQNYWIAFYWGTLLLELTIIATIIFFG